MSKFQPGRPIVHIYSRVGAPELVFFITLMAWFFIPFIFNTEDTNVTIVLNTLFVFALEYYVISNQHRFVKFISSYLLLSLTISWLNHLGIANLLFIDKISDIIMLLLSLVLVARSIFFSKEVDINTLISSVSGYVLLGYILGIAVFILETFSPKYFSFSSDFSIYDSYYYAFVTMSTLGYGEIVPTNTGGKGMAIFITLCGQFYMAIVVAMIIGKLLAPKESR